MTTDAHPRVLPQAVLDAMAGAVAQLGEAGEILGVNAAWRALAAESQLLPSTNVTTGANYVDACEHAAATGLSAAREAANAVRAVLGGQERLVAIEHTFTTPAATHWFAVVASRLGGDGFRGALVTQTDISDGKQLEAQIAQAQKMESVGRLAGGIAHDFNNLLTVVIGYAELLHTSRELPPTLRAPVGEILSAGQRAAELTRRILAFARKQRVQPRALDMNEALLGVEGVLRRTLGDDVRLDLRLAGDLAPVLIDPTQLEQVLTNLAVNADEAMPDGGTLTIASEAVEVTDEQARRRPGLRPGRHVQVSIADTGVGMDRDVLAHVFEPFFTTKQSSGRLGLGLAMCYGIVKQANGFIGFESAKGAGTTCTVLLPALPPRT